MNAEPLVRRAGCTLCAGRQQCLLGRQRDERREGWSPLVTERTVRKGERLLQQGHSPQIFRIVKTGSVLLLRAGEDGTERAIGVFGAGLPLGTTALVEQPSVLSCRALTAGRVCEVSISSGIAAGLLDAEFLRALARSYAQTNASLADWACIVRIRGAVCQTAAALLQLAKLQNSSLVRLPSHMVLADLLSTTRETIARALRQLSQHRALIRRDRSYCEIDREILTKMTAGQWHGLGPASLASEAHVIPSH